MAYCNPSVVGGESEDTDDKLSVATCPGGLALVGCSCLEDPNGLATCDGASYAPDDVTCRAYRSGRMGGNGVGVRAIAQCSSLYTAASMRTAVDPASGYRYDTKFTATCPAGACSVTTETA